MTKREWILSGLLLFFVAAAGYGFYKSHVDDARLQVQQQQHDATIKQATATRDTALAQLKQEQSKPATPQNTVQTLTKYIKVPEKVYVYDPAAKPADPAKPTTDDGDTDTAETLPTLPQPGSIIIPPADAPAFRDAQLSCQKDKVDLAFCTTAEVADKQLIHDQAIALKGGTFWRRTWTFVKIAVPAAAVGYVAAKAAK